MYASSQYVQTAAVLLCVQLFTVVNGSAFFIPIFFTHQSPLQNTTHARLDFLTWQVTVVLFKIVIYIAEQLRRNPRAELLLPVHTTGTGHSYQCHPAKPKPLVNEDIHFPNSCRLKGTIANIYWYAQMQLCKHKPWRRHQGDPSKVSYFFCFSIFLLSCTLTFNMVGKRSYNVFHLWRIFLTLGRWTWNCWKMTS